MKPKLLVIELWGLGDQAFATPFLQAASQRFAVTLLGKPYALDLQPRFWPEVNVAPFAAPWTVQRGKYRLHIWPWGELIRLGWHLRREHFPVGVSGRWDPRDHFLLFLAGVQRRIGFPRVGSRSLLTDPRQRPGPLAHRYDYWREIGLALGLDMAPREKLSAPPRRGSPVILVHCGAAQPVRVWPLERYRNLVSRLRRERFDVRVVCDSGQRDWWLEQGETAVCTPRSVAELLALFDQAALFIGNDSGPGHVAALCGLPTFTIFGPQVAVGFTPMHPQAEWLEGKPCVYKPCFDYCRFPLPYCLWEVTEPEVWPRVEAFVRRHLSAQ